MRPTAWTARGTGAFLFRNIMCPGAVVIVQIREKYVAHVPLAEDDDMIKTFPSDRATRHRSDDEGL